MNTNKNKVLLELMNPANKTIEDVANAAGLTDRTVYNYLGDDDFNRELNSQMDKALARANTQLVSLATKAVSTLRALLEDDSTSDTNKRLTAVAVLDNMLKLQEIKTLNDRLAALESAVFREGKQ